MKRTSYLTLVCAFIALTFSQCIPPGGGGGTNPTPTAVYQEFIDTSYGVDALQKMDIYLPQGRTTSTTKTIILIHGGGWQDGNKDEISYTKVIDRIKVTMPDVAIVNMNYRLVNGAGNPTLPDLMSDISLAINFLKTNANTFAISNRFALWGFSAGGHLATLYTYAYDTSGDIKVVSDWFGPTEFMNTDPNEISYSTLVSGKNMYIVQRELLGGIDRATNPTLWSNASPINRATASSKPTFIIHDNADLIVPYNHSVLLRDKLNTLGVINSFIDISYYIQNHPNNIFQLNPPLHDFTDPGICNTLDCGIFNINDYRNYAVDTTLGFIKRFL